MSKVCPSNISTIDVDHVVNNQNQSISQKQCRICLQDSLPLIIPCKCDGTVKYVHEECLKKWANEIFKKKLKQFEEEGENDTITSIDCELCKQNIDLKVEWKNIRLSFQEAHIRNQDYFWSMFLINIFIILLCLGCIVFALATLVMVLTKNSIVDYEKFESEPYLSWGALSATLLAGLVFIIKALKDLYTMFFRKQFLIEGVFSKQTFGKTRDICFNEVEKIKSLSEFKVEVDVANSRINKGFSMSKKRIQSLYDHQQQSNHDMVIPNKPQIDTPHYRFQSLPPLHHVSASG